MHDFPYKYELHSLSKVIQHAITYGMRCMVYLVISETILHVTSICISIIDTGGKHI